MKKFVYPGTFDPITLGHINVLSRAADSLCDQLIVGVAGHSGKDTMFSLAERISMVENGVAMLPDNIKEKIVVQAVPGLLIDFMQQVGARVVIRGLRAVSDFEYEFQLAEMNARLDKNIEAVFLMAAEGHHFISSRLVKEIATLGGDITPFVGRDIAAIVKKKLAG